MKTVKITKESLGQLIKEGVSKLHRKTIIENRILQINKDLSRLNESVDVVEENVMADKNYTHFAIFKPTGQIMNAWNYTGEDPEDLKADAKVYFMDDIHDMFPGHGIKNKDVSIATRKTIDKKGIDPEAIENWYRPSDD